MDRRSLTFPKKGQESYTSTPYAAIGAHVFNYNHPHKNPPNSLSCHHSGAITLVVGFFDGREFSFFPVWLSRWEQNWWSRYSYLTDVWIVPNAGWYPTGGRFWVLLLVLQDEIKLYKLYIVFTFTEPQINRGDKKNTITKKRILTITQTLSRNTDIEIEKHVRRHGGSCRRRDGPRIRVSRYVRMLDRQKREKKCLSLSLKINKKNFPYFSF